MPQLKFRESGFIKTMEDFTNEDVKSCIVDTLLETERPGIEKLVEFLKNSDFFVAPASTRFHLSAPGGLARHSLHVYYRLLEQMGHDGNIDQPVLQTCAIVGLLHDICKIGVYKQEVKNKKFYDADKVAAANPGMVKHDAMGDFVWDSVMEYKFDDPLPYGHGEKSVYMLNGFITLSREESMAIRWHMGFSEDGNKNMVSKAFAMYPLALATHIADMMATYEDERETTK